MDLANCEARLLASLISQLTDRGTPDTTSNGIILNIGNVSATGGSSLFVGICNAGVNAPPKLINLRSQVAEALQTNYVDLFVTGIEEPYGSTCSWIFDHDVYKTWWGSQGKSLLWLCGPPGCGKTILASFALRYWKKKHHNTHTAGYFFFDRQYDKAKSPLNFLSAIIHQLMLLYPSAGALIEDICGPDKLQSVESRVNSYEGLWSLLTQVLNGLSKSSDPPEKPLIYVLDAIDECSDDANFQFLRRLCREVDELQFPIKVLITCRRDYIDQLHGHIDIPSRIDIEHENASDIAKYVHGKLRIWCSKKKGNADVAATLEREIIYLAEGIFLWVVLVVEGLLRKVSRLDIVHHTIHSFPSGRDEKLRRIYEEILKQATEDSKDGELVSIKSILSIVITSAAPLTLKELEACLAAGGNGFEHLSLEHDITNTCRGLLKIEEGVVRPFHATLKTYLEDGDKCLADFHINAEEAHAQLAERCLKHAAYCVALVRDNDREGVRQLTSEHPFLRYATDTWVYHVNRSGSLWLPLVPLIRNLLDGPNSFVKWYAIVCQPGYLLRIHLRLFQWLCGETTDVSSLRATPAHVLSLLGLRSCLYANLFSSDNNGSLSVQALGPKNRDSQERAPVHWAAGSFSRFLDPSLPDDQRNMVLIMPSLAETAWQKGSDALSHILRLFPDSVETRDVNSKTPLHLSCLCGNVGDINNLLQAGAYVNSLDSLGLTPLHCACGPLGLKSVHLLIQNKANVNAKARDGTVPLHIAAFYGQEKTVEALLENGAEVNRQNTQGASALHYVALGELDDAEKAASIFAAPMEVVMGQLEIFKDSLSHFLPSLVAYDRTAERLLAACADVNLRGFDGETALHIAALRGHNELTKMLLREGADIKAANKDGFTPLYAAALGGHEPVVKLLIEMGADIKAVSKDGFAPLYAAALGGHEPVVKLLIEKGADIKAVSKDGFAPLYAAALGGHEPVVKLLIEKGADIKAVSKDGFAPLYAAALGGHEPVVKLLIEKGADIKAANKDGFTPLFAAALGGHEPVVKLLIEMGADIKAANKDGFTPLFAAALGGHEPVVKLLIEMGADIAVISNGGWTPLKAASTNGYIEVVKLLLDKGADMAVASNNGWTPLNSASSNGHVEVVKLLLDKGADITTANNDGLTPLNSASSNRHVEVVRLLLDKGADIATANNDGWTPLNSASSNGHVEVVKILLDKGADIATANNDGLTPLNSASSYGHVEVVRLLLDKGADIATANNDGWTPLNSASSYGHVEVVRLLLDKGADIATANNDGLTPLNSASSNGHVEVVNVLLDTSNANPESADTKYGRTPLSWAAGNGHEPIVELLLKSADIDRNSKDNIGRTPFFYAARNGHRKLLELLLADTRVDPGSQDHYTSTPLLTAAANGREEVVDLLVTTNRFNMDCKDSFGRTPLSWARRTGNAQIKTLLIEGSKKNSVLIGDDESIAKEPLQNDEMLRWCDVCTVGISKGNIYHECGVCNRGDFDICAECFEIDAHCLDESHGWVEKRDG